MSIKGINLHNIEVIVEAESLQRGDIDFGSLTLSVDDRECVLDVIQSYTDKIDVKGLYRISCDIEPDEYVFPDCPYNLTKSDLLDCEHNGLSRTLFVGGEKQFDVSKITLHFDDCEGQDYQLDVDLE